MIFKKDYKILREFAQNMIFQRHACLFYTRIKYECKLITFKFYKIKKMISLQELNYMPNSQKFFLEKTIFQGYML